MGKKTDRAFITQKEWVEDFGGKRVKIGDGSTSFRPLPYYSCALSFQPFEDPVVNPDGVIYDITNIIPFIQKYRVDPMSGKPLSAKDLTPLHFHKDDKGKYTCPITFKEFTDFSHIVAIKTSGNVYSWEAVEELNIKAKNWKDLLNDKPFTRADIITIHDPKDLQKRNINTFYHIQTGMKVGNEKSDPLANIQMSESQKNMLRQLNERHEKESAERKEKMQELTDQEKKSGKFSYLNSQSANFTSSSYSSNEVKVDARLVTKKVGEKGYVRLHTNLGDINLEIHSDMAPKASENFLNLCDKGYYNGTIFHRLIPGFMIQGGDPTGSGKGGQSIWGKPFGDEFHPKLQHSARGILSMANSGKDSNKSQFFITFAPCSHLNNVHTVFGKVVGGQETLARMESVETDKTNHPKETITIQKVTVYSNPFREGEEEDERKRKEKEAADKQKEEDGKRGQWYSNPIQGEIPKAVKSGVGKYIQPETSTKSSATQEESKIPGLKRPSDLELKKPTSKKQQFGDFSSW